MTLAGITNREFYLSARNLEPPAGEQMRELEVYLRALLALIYRHGEHEPGIEELLEWLKQATRHEPEPYDAAWEDEELFMGEVEGALECRALLRSIIVDLRQMRERGTFENEYRYFGVSAPSGRYWYNFDVLGFLECGVRGTMGGFEESEVIVLIKPSEGESAGSEVFELEEWGWGLLGEILICGYCYE